MMIDVDDEETLEPLNAGSRQVAALHDDGGGVVAGLDLDAIGDAMSGTPGNCINGGGAGSALTIVTCLPRARSA